MKNINRARRLNSCTLLIYIRTGTSAAVSRSLFFPPPHEISWFTFCLLTVRPNSHMTPRRGPMADDHGSTTPRETDAEPHFHASERSESGYGSMSLGPLSVQGDVLHAGELFVAGPDSGVYSSNPLDSSIRQDAAVSEPHIQSSFPGSVGVGLGPNSDWLDITTSLWAEHSRVHAALPWFPGSRVCRRKVGGAYIVNTVLDPRWSWFRLRRLSRFLVNN